MGNYHFLAWCPLIGAIVYLSLKYAPSIHKKTVLELEDTDNLYPENATIDISIRKGGKDSNEEG